ncbi:MAG: class I tRNA ligase family protein, partial [Pseudomonadota bacterium]
HGGGIDLQFPHHENEIAQSKCLHGADSFAQIWMHNEMLQVDGKKMSKSLGNFFTVRDLLDQGVSGEVIRFVFLSTHYSKPMDWTQAKADEARAVLSRWRRAISGIEPSWPAASSVLEALSDDLNTPLALTRLHALASDGDAAGLAAGLELLGFGDLGIKIVQKNSADTSVEDTFTMNMVKIAIKEARAAKDFERSDQLRDGAVDAGFEVQISKQGVELVPGPQADAKKLSGLI